MVFIILQLNLSTFDLVEQFKQDEIAIQIYSPSRTHNTIEIISSIASVISTCWIDIIIKQRRGRADDVLVSGSKKGDAAEKSSCIASTMMRTLARYFLIVLKFIFNYSAGFWQFFAFGALLFQLIDYLNVSNLFNINL
jgi:hypothetical protein